MANLVKDSFGEVVTGRVPITANYVNNCQKELQEYYKGNSTIPLSEWLGREPTESEKNWVAYANSQK